MKKLLLLTTIALAATAVSGLADTGQFGFGIELTGTGIPDSTSGNTTVLYALDNSGTNRLLPIEPANTGPTSTAILDTAGWSGSNAGNVTFSLGTFTLGSTLILDGGSYLTDKNNGSDVTSATLNYRINLGTTGTGNYTGLVNLGFNQDNVNGTTGDQRWANESAGIDLLAGLAPGTYTLSTFGDATVTSGTMFENNNGNGDFAATFTVVAVPEPGTWALMLGGLGVLIVFNIRRRQFVG